jgi:beta-xylosidase
VHADQFANPLDVRLADPQVLLDNGVYYCYATSSGNGFKVWSSPDLVNWRDRGLAYREVAGGYGTTSWWAPEVIKYQGAYYMVYSAAGGTDGYKRICIAKSTSPLGPFTDIAAPLFNNGLGYIDGHIFIDTDGKPYLFCVRDMSDPPANYSYVYVAPLNSTLTALAGSLTLCFGPSASWEGGTRKWNEAPCVIKHNGYYYCLYSANVYSSPNYAIGYATATSPLGPWTKYSGNPIVKKTAIVSGPGHCAITTSPDGQELWLVYHTQQQLSGGGARQLAIDRLSFIDQATGPDRLVVPGAPSSTLKQAPSGTPPFPAGGDDEFSRTSVDRSRWIIFNEVTGRYYEGNGALNITTVDGDTFETASADQQNIFLQYPPWEDFEISTKVNFSPGQNFEQASLFVWQDHNNFLRLSDAWIAGRRLEAGVEIGAAFEADQVPTSIGANCWLRIRKLANKYTFWASGNGTDWDQVGGERTAGLIDIKVGIGAASPGSARNLQAAFDYFRITRIASSVEDWSLYGG